jgi:Lrp/AsnC family leucine-responsive transcriptional regulator
MANQKNPDDIDCRILAILQDEARTSIAEIARQVGMAPSAVFERMRKLETAGTIVGYEARLNPASLDRGLLAFVSVQVRNLNESFEVQNLIAAIPEVQELHHVAGDDCFLLKVRVANTTALDDLLRNRLGSIAAIRNTRTTIVLATAKETMRLPLGPGGSRSDD